MDLVATWQAVLGELELSLSKANFTTWFKNTFICSIDGGKIVVCVPNTFTKTWLEKKYHDQIMKALRSLTNNTAREIIYRVEVKNTTPVPGLYQQATEEYADPSIESIPSYTAAQQQGATPAPNATTSDVGFNPRYTFDSYIVGKANELAHAASIAVATKPGLSYNPLFLYGGSGLGKTHLLHAIGGHISAANRGIKILYVSCERFINEFIQAIRGGHGREFKDTYRNVDVLLIDDIQFITGKESTQEEFFHTFNALHQANKQVVITSDRHPKDIQALESRLLTRFEWGMMADISSPDFETRVAILDAKSRERSVSLTSEILRYIAGTIQSNVRELEGALNKLIAYHQFKNIAPTIESVQTLLHSYVPSVPKRSISPRRLIEIVIGHYEVSLDELLGKSREQRLALPRQVAMYLLRQEAKCSFPTIGGHLGGRDHTTAMHGCDKIGELLKSNDQLKRDVSNIREKLYSSATSG